MGRRARRRAEQRVGCLRRRGGRGESKLHLGLLRLAPWHLRHVLLADRRYLWWPAN